MGDLSIRLHSQFAIFKMTMQIPEDFRMLWTEHFERNDLNALYGTKRFENETECFGDGTKRFEKETKRFENGTLLMCSSAVQGLYPKIMNEV